MNRNIHRKAPVSEPLFNEAAAMNFIKKRLQRRYFPKNIQNLLIILTFFIEHFRWLLLNGKMEKVKQSKLRKECKCREAATGDAL